MRKAMKSSVLRMLQNHKNTMLILIDIGAFGFRQSMGEYPDQIKNIGIFEPGTISIAAGLAISGIVPTVYGISPFIVQRSLEQLKLNFVYQKVGGNFITTGASYDFSELGYSHYCPEDVDTLKTLPGMEIIVPGTPKQFETLFAECCMNGHPSYFRMTDYGGKADIPVSFGKAAVIKKGAKATVIAFAEMLDAVMEATMDLDVTILYYTTAEPFDKETLRNHIAGGKIFICSPFYEGTFAHDIALAVKGAHVKSDELAVPRNVIRSYGTKPEKDQCFGLTSVNIRNRLMALIH